MTRPHGRRLLVVGCLLLPIVVAGASAAAAEPTASFHTTDPQTEGTPVNGTQVLHERPGTASQSGNASAVERRLAGQLADRLTRSARQIDAGDHEAAQRAVGVSYDERLSLYMDGYRAAVTTDIQRVEQREALFTETADLQSRYAQTLGEYRQIESEYTSARQAGDRNRAQRRARELRNRSRELQRTADALAVRYRLLSDTTDVSLSAASRIVADTTGEITQQTDQYVQATYTQTTLSADASGNGSFARPIRVTGQLSAPEDAPPSGNATFLVNGRPHTGRIASDGSVSLRYRPVTAPTGPVSIPVAYAPDEAALHLPSSTTVTTTIEQVSPTIGVRNATTTARLGSTVAAAGRLTAGNAPVSNASVALYLDDRRIAETRTDGNAEYRLRTTLPANVSVGSRTLSIQAGAADTAVAPVSETRTLTVEETDARITLSAVRREGTVVVSGRLLTTEGAGLSDQSVLVSVNDDQQRAVRTDSNGNYEAAFDIPESATETGSLPIRADFDGSRTNLASASVSASLGQPGGSEVLGETSLLIAFLTGLALASGGVYVMFGNRSREAGSDRSIPPTSVAPKAASPFDRPATESSDWRHRLDRVDDHLETGDTDRGVLELYGLVRGELDRDEDSASTHWEFFRTVADDLTAEQRSVLRDLTETVESVQYADRDPDTEEVATLRTEVERLLSDRDDGPAGPKTYTEEHP